MKKRRNAKSSRQQLEFLEERRLLSSVAVSGGSLELTGDVNQSNAFLVRAAPPNRVLGFANNFGECVSLSTVSTVVIYLGDETDTVTVTTGVTTPVEVISQSGQVTWLTAGTSETFNGSAASSGNGSSSSSGNSSNGGNSDPSGGSTGSSGSSSDGSSSSGSSSSGSSSNGSSSSGSSSNGSSSSGSSGSGSSGSGSSGSGSSGSGSSSSGSSGSGSSSSGSSGTGSSGSGSSGSGSSGAGSSGSGSSSSPSDPSDPSDPSTPQPVITLSSPATVLPNESVNVNALASSFGDGTVLNSEIAWNFGDPGSAYNTLVGFNVAHAYADPGTYTITLTITTPDGQVGVATQQVTVSQDNRTTIYVSPNGNDSNNGLSQSTAIQSIARLNQLLTSNMSVLFQAGGTYTLGTSEVVNLSGLQHVLLGSYGSGAQPVLYYDGVAQGGTFIGLSSSSQGIVVEGLTFDSIFVDNDDKQAIPSGIVTQGNDISILNNTFLNLADDLLQGGQPATNVLVQGNNSPSVDDLSGYFYYMGGGSNIVVVGNTVAGSSAEAVLREAGATNLEVAGNNFTEPAAAGTTSGKAVLSIQEGEYAYIYDNTISNGPAQTGPIGTPQANPSGIFQYAVYDSNTLVNGASFVISPNAINIMYKNNVVIGNGITGFTINAQEVWGSFDWQAQNIYIEYNTVTDPSGASGGFLSINNGEASNVYLDNNLFYDPGFLIGEAAFIKVDENDLSSFAQIQNNVWPVPVDLSQSWEQGGAFFVSANASLQSGWLSPAEWEATGLPTGDVYQNVDLGATYQVTVNGITAGSNLPIA